MLGNPPPRTARFTAMPGWGSANRAGPTGIKGEARMAMVTAMAAPATEISAIVVMDVANSWRFDMPIERRASYSLESKAIRRTSAWPMIRRAAAPSSPPKTSARWLEVRSLVVPGCSGLLDP